MNSSFFIDIGIAVLLRLLSDGKIPSKYVKALTKLRDALNLAFPPNSNTEGAVGSHITIEP